MFSTSHDNRNMSLRSAMTLVIILFSFIVCRPQSINGVNTTGNDGNEEIQGSIHFPSGHKPGIQPVVKLQGIGSSELTAFANLDGSFSFTRLRPDSYTIVVNGGDEYETARETVAVGNSGPVPAQGNPWDYAHPLVYQVQIYLQPKRLNGVDAKAATTAAALANVPRTARDLFNTAIESARLGQSATAIEQFKAAILQSRNFGLAYNEMGMQYLKLGQLTKAAEAFAAAVKLNPDEFEWRLNYGIALLNLKKFTESEEQLRQALHKNAAAPTAHYYLGLALMNRKEFEASETEFKTSINNSNDAIAAAHKYLGGIYWRNKQYAHAADELEKYLKLDPKATDADKVRGTIKDLRFKQ